MNSYLNLIPYHTMLYFHIVILDLLIIPVLHSYEHCIRQRYQVWMPRTKRQRLKCHIVFGATSSKQSILCATSSWIMQTPFNDQTITLKLGCSREKPHCIYHLLIEQNAHPLRIIIISKSCLTVKLSTMFPPPTGAAQLSWIHELFSIRMEALCGVLGAEN